MLKLNAALMIVLGIGSIFGTIACSTAKSGNGSVSEDGTVRDPGELVPVGAEAPDFQTVDHNGNAIKLSDYRGDKNVVLIFYPADETPGCTKQLCQARDDFERYEENDVVVFGVNPAGEENHDKFAEKYNFQFGLIVDIDGEVVRKYGCRGVAGFVKRTVYVIDKEGKIAFAERGMPGTEAQLASITAADGSES